jgi:hypothetical protein
MVDLTLSTTVHSVTPVVGGTGKTLHLFISGQNVVPVAATDDVSVQALKKQLGAAIGTATVVGGVVNIKLSAAAEGRCHLARAVD